MAEETSLHQKILVVGGGMSGLTTALEAAEAGYETIIVERNPYLGGRVAQMNQYFPKLCPPSCGLEINFRRIKSNPQIRFLTGAQVDKIEGQAGNFTAFITRQPRYINDKCTACGKCAEVVETMVDNPFNYGLNQVKAVYLPHLMAFPSRYVMDPAIVNGPEGQKIKEVCPFDAVDLEAQEEKIELPVGAVVWATGWDPYEAKNLDTYGFGEYPNVITNVQMERLASQEGPTGGRIVRPSDGQPPKKVVFVQCAGSRDINHLAYCSGVCCLASIKQATYIREQLPETEVKIMFIDIRAQDRLEEVYQNAQQDEVIQFVKGKVATIDQDPATNNLTLEAENTATLEKITVEADLVVLATGMVPNNQGAPQSAAQDEYGFVLSDSGLPGFVGAGVARRPFNVAECVQDATRAALMAIQTIARR
ncbi:MAG: CoB--CoM heterodisulfide reductase iron-sulfur subunit A family protein [Deltaproteobacteria bacterium]|nr:CoB--CoM heterodisulfide reductase iron-sulfur subunit A family protein [Deltaproteobacteria bacterium]